MAAVRVPLSAVQAAIWDRVTSEYPTWSIFAYSPIVDPPFPYTVFGQMRGASDDTKSSNGCIITYPLDSYSQSTGTTELNGILNGLVGALTGTELVIDDDWQLVEFDYTWSAVTAIGDEKGPIQHGTIELTMRLNDVS